MDCAIAGAASHVRYTAGHQVSSRHSALTLAAGLGLFALAVYVGYIVWIGLKF